MIEIKDIKGEVIFASVTAKTVKEAVEEAVRFGISLACADLNCFYLSYGNFEGGDFTGAGFCHTNLSKANFSGAILEGAYFLNTDISGAIISEEQLNQIFIQKPVKLYDGSEEKDTKKMETEDIEKKEIHKVLLHPPIIKEAEVLQPLEIIVTGKDNPYYAPGHTVFFRGVEFMVEKNKCVETLTRKTQRIKLILK